jgi:DNA topoisomerase-1
MAKAIIESNQLFLAPINSKKKVEKFLMVGSVSKVIFEGYLRVYKDLEEETVNINIPEDYSKLEIKMKTIKLKESLTSPPTRYNEASLVKKLEQLGIGRPSTYAAMISKIQKQDYVRVDNISGQEKLLKELVIEDNNIKINDVKVFLGKENKKLVPTKIGILIVNFLIKHFPQIMDYQFTALLENDLDEISKGNKEWTNILRAFYEVLEKQILEFIKIAPINNVKNYVNNEIIGINNEQDIIYTKTKFGFAIKTFDTTLKKDLWVSVKTKPSLNEAINLFKTKQDNPIAASTLIKKIDNYQIKQGPYGPYIQIQIGKGVKFFKIFGKKPEELTLEDCKEICLGKKKTTKTTKKTTKKIEI